MRNGLSHLWYLIQLSGPIKVIGGSIPGIPGGNHPITFFNKLVLIGRNEHISWSLSNSLVDTQV